MGIIVSVSHNKCVFIEVYYYYYYWSLQFPLGCGLVGGMITLVPLGVPLLDHAPGDLPVSVTSVCLFVGSSIGRRPPQTESEHTMFIKKNDEKKKQ